MPPNLQQPQGLPPRPQVMQQMQPEQGGPAVSEEEKAALLSVIEEVKSKMKTFSAQTDAVNGQGEQQRIQMLKKVFNELQAAGVDLTSKESVATFLEDLKAENPEVAKAFEAAMDILLGLPPGTPLTEEDPSMQQAEPVDPGAALGIPQEGGDMQNNMNIQNPNESLLKG